MCPQTFVSFSRWKKVEESVFRVLDYTVWFSKTARSVDSVNEWEAGLSDGLGFVYNLL